MCNRKLTTKNNMNTVHEMYHHAIMFKCSPSGQAVTPLGTLTLEMDTSLSKRISLMRDRILTRLSDCCWSLPLVLTSTTWSNT